MMEILQKLLLKVEVLKNEISVSELNAGLWLFQNNYCQILTQSATKFEVMVAAEKGEDYREYAINITEETIYPEKDKHNMEWEGISYACLLQIIHELKLLNPKLPLEHKKYTRKGMIKRVMEERRQKAEKAAYKVIWADNIYGDHTVINEKGVRYRVFLRDFENETGYSDSKDVQYNKLGTSKHIMFAFQQLKNDVALYENLNKTYPFIEIFCDPLNDYKISWHYPHVMPARERQWIKQFFGNTKYIEDDKVKGFLDFVELSSSSPLIRIRPEVSMAIEALYEKEMLDALKDKTDIPFQEVKAELYAYQKQGVEFATFKKAAIIADEMGLGKTLQAITTAIAKKHILGHKKTLIITPASLKVQWKQEIEKFTKENALIIEGSSPNRKQQYADEKHFFWIANYETVMRDRNLLSNADIDFLILDEAQRIKNFETKTASAVSRLRYKHVLVLTGTPIENKLIDIYSIVNIISPNFFGPLWEFSYQHCLFDSERTNKINGYYDLQKIHQKIKTLLIRREKRNVLQQLPNIVQVNVPILLSPLQEEMHAGFAKGLSVILRKKFHTPFDLQKIQQLLASMRMVCDSTYLIDDQTNESPKLNELTYILLQKLDVGNSEKKIIIFSEWVKVHKLIGKILREHNIGFAELNGSVPVRMRSELIKKFEKNPQCKVFLSTEAGGAGLNLQVADTVINFELPWNPAKKNQRIGRIDRLGQKNTTLTIYNFITKNSIEEQIASGLMAKQSIFDGVLSSHNASDFVDLSAKGRSQFIEQLEAFIAKINNETPETGDEDILTSIDSEEEKGLSELLLSEDTEDIMPDIAIEKPSATHPVTPSASMEQVLQSGLQFLSSLMKLSTGQDMQISDQNIKVNKETGEVTLSFKLPVQ